MYARFYATWTGLTSALVYKHIPKIIQTVKGHLRQGHKNPCSTKNNNQPDIMTAPEELEITCAWAYLDHVKIVDTSGNISSNQMSRFPITSRQGWKYIMVLHDFDRNVILEEPLKSCAESDICWALTSIYKHITDRGIQPRPHMLNNEFSAGMKIFICLAGSQHQMLPPGLHHALISKREIQTFKQHFISGLSSCKPNPLLHLWRCLIW